MLDHVQGDVSESFMKLQRIRRSFDEVDSLGRAQERSLKRLARELGGPCIRLCTRELGASSQRSRWASMLLEDMARHDEHRIRVLAVLQRLALEPSEPTRVRAASLLVSLGHELPAGVLAGRSHEITERSVLDLAHRLTTAAGVAWVGDMLATRLPAYEMLVILNGLCTRAPDRAMALLSELLLRNDLEESARREVKRLRATMSHAATRAANANDSASGSPTESATGFATAPTSHQANQANRSNPNQANQANQEAPRVANQAVPSQPLPVSTATVGRHANGRRAIVAWRKSERVGARIHRVLCLLTDVNGVLCDGSYRDDMPRGGAEEHVLEPLRRQGFQLETASRTDAAQLVIQAARAAHHAGRRLPRAFYLGRDLFGVHDQHAVGMSAESDLPALLERAGDLLAAGDAEGARPLFERFVAHSPEDAAGCAGLAMCLLRQDDVLGAAKYLNRAVWLQPDNPNHHWNLAAVAHRQGRRGSCYLALLDYLDHSGECDEAPGDASSRRRLAERFVAEYQRVANLEYPGAEPVDVADVDEIVLRAWRCVRAHEHEQAVSALDHAFDRVPDHYPALTCLGIALAGLARVDEACARLEQALALRPGFPLALQALTRLRQSASTIDAANTIDAVASESSRALVAQLLDGYRATELWPDSPPPALE